MPTYNLGNVVGMLKGPTAPSKTYVLWAKEIDPNDPDIVVIHYYDHADSQWKPLVGGGSGSAGPQSGPTRVVGPGQTVAFAPGTFNQIVGLNYINAGTLVLPASTNYNVGGISFANFTTLNIQGGVLQNLGVVYNSGLITNTP